MQDIPDITPVVAKPWWTSRTMLFNIVGAILFAIGLFLENYQPLGIEIPHQAAAWLAMISLIGNGYLRTQTVQPIGTKREVIRMDNRAIKREMRDR